LRWATTSRKLVIKLTAGITGQFFFRMKQMYAIGTFLRCNRSQHPVVVVQHLDFLEGMYLFNDDTPWYLVSIREFGGDYGVVSHENELRPLDLTIYQKLHGDWWEQKHRSVFQSLVIEALG